MAMTRSTRSTRLGLALALATGLTACDWMDMTIAPQTILTDDQVWGQPDLITGVLADYYSRLPFHTGFESQDDRTTMAAYDDAIFSGIDNLEFLNNYVEYPYNFDRWNNYNLDGDDGTVWTAMYDLLRDIHVAIDGIAEANSPTLTEPLKQQFTAELRFLRAFVYFELVKRYGGVPLVTEQLLYDFSGDPSSLQLPRAAEAEVYDFIGSELDAIKDQLVNEGSQTRANRYTALALESRAMLYAASIARHNGEASTPVTLPGGEVGIPESRAAEYYQASLDASRELINSGAYSLYQNNPEPGPNFYETLTNKTGNTEVIMAVDYAASQGRSHAWTRDVIPNSMVQDAEAIIAGSAISPTLQLVETFDYLDGSSGEMRGVGDGSNTAAGQAAWIFYDEIDDIFDGKDGRLYGTIIYPGTSFAGQDVEM
ncbi:MAG: RagB/SusD family nutrient uptake outer membrane protein, partial [Longimicrobiales bacterium]